MANGENARIWQVVRFCCTSGQCIDCKLRGNLFGSMAKRARIVHANNLTKPFATKMASNWRSYDAEVEAMK